MKVERAFDIKFAVGSGFVVKDKAHTGSGFNTDDTDTHRLTGTHTDNLVGDVLKLGTQGGDTVDHEEIVSGRCQELKVLSELRHIADIGAAQAYGIGIDWKVFYSRRSNALTKGVEIGCRRTVFVVQHY